MHVIVLGSAAGGGFPQWNCNCANCRRARTGDPAATPRSQSSLAVSADGERWVLLNASPDIRQQIERAEALRPRHGVRHSPIAGAILTNGDVDHIAGLLSLRESQPLAVYATARVLEVLDANPVFDVLRRDIVARRPLALDAPVGLRGVGNEDLGLNVEAFAVPGKIALYLENADMADFGTLAEDTIGLRVDEPATQRAFFYVPGCASLPAPLAGRLRGAALVFFDGTTWRDDEMAESGAGEKTAARMGHMCMRGDSGSMAAFAGLGVSRKIYVHINNTNPVLLEDSSERATAEAAGWDRRGRHGDRAVKPLLTPAELEEHLRAIGAERYHSLHPFHRLLHAGRLTKGQVQAWALNRYCYQAAIPRKDLTLMSRMDDRAMRRAWLHRVAEHDGGGDNPGGIERWLILTDGLGLDRGSVMSMRLALPATRFAVEAYIRFVGERDVLEGIASSLTELFAPAIHKERIAGMLANYDFIGEEVMQYFRRRLVEAPRDVSFALDYVKREARTPERQRAVFDAVRFKCDVLWAQLDALHFAYVEPGLPPPGAFIADIGR